MKWNNTPEAIRLQRFLCENQGRVNDWPEWKRCGSKDEECVRLREEGFVKCKACFLGDTQDKEVDSSELRMKYIVEEILK